MNALWNDLNDVEADSPSVRALWERLTTLPYPHGKALLLKGLPENTVLTAYDSTRGQPGIEFRRLGEGKDTGLTDINFYFSVERDHIDFQRGRAHARGRGIAARIHYNMLALANLRGIRKFTVETSQIGSYLWAKAGYRPHRENWEALQCHLQGRTARLRQWNDDHQAIPGPLLDLLQRAADSHDPRSIWTIADIRYPYGKATLGKTLLESTGWEGYCDLTDSAARGRLEAYVAGRPPQLWQPLTYRPASAWLRQPAPIGG